MIDFKDGFTRRTNQTSTPIAAELFVFGKEPRALAPASMAMSKLKCWILMLQLLRNALPRKGMNCLILPRSERLG